MMYPRWFRLSPRDGTTDREICANPLVKPSGGTPPTLIHRRRITTFPGSKRSDDPLALDSSINLGGVSRS